MTALARALGRDDRNTRPVVEALIRKLSVAIAREQDSPTGHPRIYFVFAPAEIFARRRRAGLEWAVKNKGIQLLTAGEAAALAAANQTAAPLEDVAEDLAGLYSTPHISTPVKTVDLSQSAALLFHRPLSGRAFRRPWRTRLIAAGAVGFILVTWPPLEWLPPDRWNRLIRSGRSAGRRTSTPSSSSPKMSSRPSTSARIRLPGREPPSVANTPPGSTARLRRRLWWPVEAG